MAALLSMIALPSLLQRSFGMTGGGDPNYLSLRGFRAASCR
jgi:hypothetical protein